MNRPSTVLRSPLLHGCGAQMSYRGEPVLIEFTSWDGPPVSSSVRLTAGGETPAAMEVADDELVDCECGDVAERRASKIREHYQEYSDGFDRDWSAAHPPSSVSAR